MPKSIYYKTVGGYMYNGNKLTLFCTNRFLKQNPFCVFIGFNSLDTSQDIFPWQDSLSRLGNLRFEEWFYHTLSMWTLPSNNQPYDWTFKASNLYSVKLLWFISSRREFEFHTYCIWHNLINNLKYQYSYH